MNIHLLAFLILFQYPFVFPVTDSQQELQKTKPGLTNIIFKSMDGGETWQDISGGLPGKMGEADGQEDIFFATNNGLYLRAANGIYFSKPNATEPFWKKEVSPEKPGSIAPGKTGIYAYHYQGQILQKSNGTTGWSPVYTNFRGSIRTVFETAGGTVFIGSDNGLFKSTNNGKTWNHVHTGGWVIKLVESHGVLVATSMSGIIRSTDDGDNWALVISEGGVGIDIEPIKGGFAAITFNTQSNTRRVRTSYDGGKTWQPIDADLPASLSIASIIQVGEYFFCGHPDGIFRSADKGKTWKLLLPSVENKVFNLYGSGNVIYAIPRNAGC